jgi:hypothetical protein
MPYREPLDSYLPMQGTLIGRRGVLANGLHHCYSGTLYLSGVDAPLTYSYVRL